MRRGRNIKEKGIFSPAAADYEQVDVEAELVLVVLGLT